jgi:HK97 family phage portal protein
LEEYAGRFFQNDSTPPFAIVVPGKISQAQGRTMLDVFEASHSGLANAHRPALLSNGATVETLGVSMRDAQFIEGENLTTQQVAQIWNWPLDLLSGGDTANTQRLSVEQLGLRLLTFSVAPRLRRIEKGLLADPDLFPPGSGLFPRFTTHDLIRLDASTLASVVHSQIQDGMLNPNEGRAEFGRPPRDGGDEYLQTPVGAAPNDAPKPPADPTGTLEKP